MIINEYWTQHPIPLSGAMGGRYEWRRLSIGMLSWLQWGWHQPRRGVDPRTVEMVEGLISEELYFIKM
jgi:hypothetical protein